MMTKLIKVFFVITILTTLMAGEWLDIAPDARSTALGGISVGIADSVYAPYWNPALLDESGSVFAFSQFKIMDELDYDYIGYVTQTVFGNLGIAFMQTNDSGYKNTDSNWQEIGGDFNWSTNTFLLSLSNRLNILGDSNPVRIGATGKYISESLADSEGVGFGFDAGFQMKIMNGVFSLGGVMYNALETNMKWKNAADETLPLKTKFGIGFRPLPGLLIGADYWLGGYRYNKFAAGVEYTLMDFLALRAGYQKISNSDQCYSAGVGIKYSGLNLDVSYALASDLTSAYLSNAAKFSISFDLLGLKQEKSIEEVETKKIPIEVAIENKLNMDLVVKPDFLYVQGKASGYQSLELNDNILTIDEQNIFYGNTAENDVVINAGNANFEQPLEFRIMKFPDKIILIGVNKTGRKIILNDKKLYTKPDGRFYQKIFYGEDKELKLNIEV